MNEQFLNIEVSILTSSPTRNTYGRAVIFECSPYNSRRVLSKGMRNWVPPPACNTMQTCVISFECLWRARKRTQNVVERCTAVCSSPTWLGICREFLWNNSNERFSTFLQIYFYLAFFLLLCNSVAFCHLFRDFLIWFVFISMKLCPPNNSVGQKEPCSFTLEFRMVQDLVPELCILEKDMIFGKISNI